MQATVHHFDTATRNGTVVTDGGELIPFSASVFDESALLTLRPGQRLIVTLAGSGTDTRVTAFALESVGVVPARPSRP